jgi:hypothetical protein
MVEFVLLQRPRLDIEPGFQQDWICFLDQKALPRSAVGDTPPLDYRDVRVTLGTVVASGAAAKQHKPSVFAAEPRTKLAVELA